MLAANPGWARLKRTGASNLQLLSQRIVSLAYCYALDTCAVHAVRHSRFSLLQFSHEIVERVLELGEYEEPLLGVVEEALLV